MNSQERNLKSNIQFLFKDSIIYGAASALGKSLSLLTMPLIIRSIIMEEFGLYDLFINLVALLTSFFVFGMDSAVARYFQPLRDEKKRILIISTGFYLQILFLGFSIPILLFFGVDILEMYNINEKYYWVWFYIIFNSLLMSILNFAINILKWNFKRTQFLILTLGSSLAFSLFLSLSYLFQKLDFKFLLALNLGINILFVFLGLLYIRHYLKLTFNKSYANSLLKFSIPMGLTVVFLSISPSFERYFISTHLGLSELATYAVAVKISYILAFMSSAFQVAWGPFSLKLLSESNRVITFNFVLKMLVFVLLLLTVVIFLVSKSLILILAKSNYLEASRYIMPICLALVIQNFGLITEIGITFSEKAKYFTFINLVGLISTICFLYISVPILGLVGISYSYLVGTIIRVSLSTYFSTKLFPMQWDLKMPIFLIFFVFLSSVFFSFYIFKEIYLYLFVSMLLFLLILFGFKFLINSKEKKLILLIFYKTI